MLLSILVACSDQKLGTFNGEPTAEILSHQDGDLVVEGSTVTFRGSVGDPDDPNATLGVMWYADATPACDAAPDDDGGTTCDIPITGTLHEVLLEVHDPDGAAASDKVTLSVVPLESPAVAITAPLGGAHLYTDLPVDLAGTVTDGDDLPDSLTYTWTSDRDGDLGAGTVAADSTVTDVTFLTQGTHTLTLTATDDDGNVGNAEVGVTVGGPNGAPGCTITNPTDGALLRLGEETLLTGTATDPDQASETLSAAWSSDLDGPLGGSAPDSAGAVTLRTSALSAGTHLLSLVVTDELDAVCTATVRFTVGGPPSVVIDNPVDGDTVAEGDVVELVGTVIDDLDAPDVPLVQWESDRDGVLWTGSADASGGVAHALDTLSSGLHTITLTATDSDGLSASDRIALLVNGLPSAPGVTLSPDPATSADTLTATITTASVDPEGSAVAYTYAWYVDGVLSGASSSASLPASATTRGETWQVVVTPDDGLHNGPAGSDAVTIGNAVPSVASVAISPSPATAGDTLTCTATGFADADGDADRSTYAWTNGSTPIGTGTSISTGYRRGDLVTCTVTPADGTTTGTPVAASVTIDNAPPSVDAVSIAPSSPDTDDTLSASVTTSDPDADGITLAYAWYVDGALAGSSSTLSGATAFDKGDVVYVTVTPNDGADTGTARTSASVTVQNTAPTAPSVAISPTSPTEGVDDLWCQVTGASTDLDGDGITYTVSWTVDGLPWFGATTTVWPTDTIDAADTTAGERWTCTVTPDDGDVPGATATASVTIQAGDTDYSDTWTMDTSVSYTCAFGLVNYNFNRLTIVDGYPSISVRASGNVGTMTGTFSAPTDFTADNYLPGTCAETYTITGTFTDANTLDATLDATYVGSCYGCTSRSWVFTATR